MVQECYDWVWKLAGYLIFMTAVLQLVPGEKDRKYIHFFIGLVSDFGSKIFLCYFMLLLRIIFVHIYHIAVDLNNCISAE